MAKSSVNSVFSLFPSLRFLTQNRPFSPDSAGFRSKTTFFEAFPSSLHWIFSPKISFCADKISWTGRISSSIARISTFAGEKKKEVGVFLSLPHSTQKIQAYFLSKHPHFSRLPPLFHLKLPHPAQTPIQILRAGHAPTRIYAPALSANLPFLPSPFTFTTTI